MPTTGTVPALTPAEPVRISIPPLAVTADVVPVTTSSGTLDVPTDPRQVGWWTGGALADAAHGSVVLDGHIDSAVSGLGALFRLGTLHDGDPILLTTTTSQQQRYAVIGRRVYVKTDGLPADLFTTTGPARLVIITCGGPFDHQTGSYLDNVVVFAAPS